MKNLTKSGDKLPLNSFETKKGRVIEMLNTQSERLFSGFKSLFKQGHMPWADNNLSFLPYHPVTGEFFKGVHHLAILNKTFQRVDQSDTGVGQDLGYSTSPWFIEADECPGAQRVKHGATAHTLAVDLSRLDGDDKGLDEFLSNYKGRTLVQVDKVSGIHPSFDQDQKIDLGEALDDILTGVSKSGIKVFCLRTGEAKPGYYPANDALVVDMETFVTGHRGDQLGIIAGAIEHFSYGLNSIRRGGVMAFKESAKNAPSEPISPETVSPWNQRDLNIEYLRAHYVTSCLFKAYDLEDPWNIPFDHERMADAVKSFEVKGDPMGFYLSMVSFGQTLDKCLEMIGGGLGRSFKSKLDTIEADSARMRRQYSPNTHPGEGSTVTIDLNW